MVSDFVSVDFLKSRETCSHIHIAEDAPREDLDRLSYTRGKTIFAARCWGRCRDASAFRKIIHTPTRTSAAPNNDEGGNVSPPNNQPSMTAHGGVMSEMLCNCATVRRGSSQ